MEVALSPDIPTLRAQLCAVERRADIAEADAANAKAVNAGPQRLAGVADREAEA